MTDKSEFSPLTSDGEDGGCCKKLIRGVRPYLAEFVGVSLFVFVGCMSVTDKSPIAIAVAHGLAIAALVACFGHISGGHLNPAVTLGVAVTGGIGPIKALLYLLSQTLGGVLGAILVRLVLDLHTMTNKGSGATLYLAINGGAHAVNTDVHIVGAVVVEVLITSTLVLTVLITAVDEEGKTALCPLYIGLAVTVGVLAGFNCSGGSMNPARSFGPALVRGSPRIWSCHYVYWVGPGLGALLAALLYKMFFATDSARSGCCGRC